METSDFNLYLSICRVCFVSRLKFNFSRSSYCLAELRAWEAFHILMSRIHCLACSCACSLHPILKCTNVKCPLSIHHADISYAIHLCIPSCYHSRFLLTNNAIDCCVGLMSIQTDYGPELVAAEKVREKVLNCTERLPQQSNEAYPHFLGNCLPSTVPNVLISTQASGRLPSTPPILRHQERPLTHPVIFSELSKKDFITR